MKTSNNFLIKVNGHTITGGPRAMLQLGSKLQELGAHVSLCFDDVEAKELFTDWVNELLPKAEIVLAKYLNNYNNYNLIVTETDLRILKELNWSGSIVCYMLSVDNCAAYGLKRLTIEANIRHLKHIVRQIYFRNHVSWAQQSARVDLFVAQSHYAMEILVKSSSTPIFLIGDYIDSSKSIFEKKNRSINSKTKLRVCFNPNKGRIYSAIARFFNKSVQFIPIQGLNDRQLVELYQTCDAYVDFGSQPGKDRLPREAIACNCPSFIRHSGAGFNYSDFPRSKEFRFKISQLLSLDSIMRTGIELSYRNPLFNRSRAAEVLVEEREFSLRVEQLMQILG